jgi:hypothetical protein
MTTPRLTTHAIERFQERALPGSSILEAHLALRQFVSMGRARPNPRHWMSDRRPRPGSRYVYWAGRPRVCAIVKGGAVVTFVTGQLVKSSGRRHLRLVPPPAPLPASQKVTRWRWDRMIESPGFEGADQEAA